MVLVVVLLLPPPSQGRALGAASVAVLSVTGGRMPLPLKEGVVPHLATSDAIISLADRNTNARTHLQLNKMY